MKCVLLFLFCCACLAFAAIPPYINYQGQLASPSGAPLDTTVGITFTIYDALTGGLNLWTESHSTVVVQNGLFHANLGINEPIPDVVLHRDALWLGVKVGDDTEMIPRVRVLSAPYAILSGTTGDISATNVQDAIEEWSLIPDADGDGFDKSELGGDDCDDWNPFTHPFAPEICDFKDNDCDGSIDEGHQTAWFVDADGDGWGNMYTPAIVTCDPPPGYVAQNGDCDDANPVVHPTAFEICDGEDNDCNGLVDNVPGAPGCINYFRDTDSDGYGWALSSICSCAPEPPYTALQAGDCYDFDAGINPGAVEICDDGIDNDCDGLTDFNDPNCP